MEDKKTIGVFQSLWPFVLKTIAVLVLIGIFLDAMLPDAADMKQGLSNLKVSIAKNFKDERARLYLLSFVQNPAALYKTSEIEEREGRIPGAIRDVELAIGLLEMHGADKQVIKRYNDRLSKLKATAK